MMDDFEPRPDRRDRAIRFAFGVPAGVGLGWYYGTPHNWILMPVGGLLVGFLAAWKGERVWRWIRDWSVYLGWPRR